MLHCSQISLDTVQRSRGRISKIFLRGTGVPEIFLDYIQTQGNAPFDFVTIPISLHSTERIKLQ